MDKRTRAYRIYEVGTTKQGCISGLREQDWERLALMVDFATAKVIPKKVEPSGSVKVFDVLFKALADDGIILRPNKIPWARMGGIIKEYTVEQVETTATYLRNGGWVGKTPTLNTILRCWPDLVDQACASGGETAEPMEFV